MNVKKILYLCLGFLGLGLGAIGAVLPILPSFPFMLIAGFGFSKSSEKLERWFKGTKLYKENLEDFVTSRGMTKRAKIRIMITVTILVSIGLVMMNAVTGGRIILVCVWGLHIVYFIFGIKTIPVKTTSPIQ